VVAGGDYELDGILSKLEMCKVTNDFTSLKAMKFNMGFVLTH